MLSLLSSSSNQWFPWISHQVRQAGCSSQSEATPLPRCVYQSMLPLGSATKSDSLGAVVIVRPQCVRVCTSQWFPLDQPRSPTGCVHQSKWCLCVRVCVCVCLSACVHQSVWCLCGNVQNCVSCKLKQQECIPVGCVLPTRYRPGKVFVRGGAGLCPGGGLCLGGVSVQGVSVWGVSP